jgi:hypothetical protein
MMLRSAVLSGAAAAVLTSGCGDTQNGFATYGSGKLQGFVSRTDGTPLADIEVFAGFGPDAFGLSARTDRRGLYELQGFSHQPLDEPPFTDSVIPCRLIIAPGLADTIVPVRFAATNRIPVPVTVNFVVDPP